MSEKYNGWTNRETWLIGLWWDEYVHETAQSCRSQAEFIELMKDDVDAANPLNGKANLFADLISGAIARIDWYDIAKHYTEYWNDEEDE